MKKLRAFARAVAALPVLGFFVAGAVIQATFAGPLLKSKSTIPNMMYKTLGRLFGYKIVFNKASAPIAQQAPVWYVANHMSISDFIVMGSKFNGTFAGKGDIAKWPVVAQLAKAIKFIGIRRSSEFNPESRGKFVENFNTGTNAIMFPEGTTSDGKRVHLFRAALPGLLYGESAVNKNNQEVTLQKNVVVQPVAIRVAAINGKDATGNDDLRNLYSMYEENHTLSRIWKRLQIRETKIELTVFPPLAPADFSDAKELMNKAALDIASIVNPGQTAFEKKNIPVKTLPVPQPKQ